MPSHHFLSAAWISEARRLHAEFADRITPPSEAVRMNVTVIDAPFSDDEVLGHLDTTSGSLIPELGHLDNADLTIRVPYSVAREMLVEQQFENLMISFMTGEIEVEGDVSLIMAIQELDPTEEQRAFGQEVSDRLRDITE